MEWIVCDLDPVVLNAAANFCLHLIACTFRA